MLVKDIRSRLQTQLDINHLVEKIEGREIDIEEHGKNAAFKKLTITHLPSETSRIWRINLEKEIKGLSTANKTGEIALAILKNNFLNVYIIELKSTIKDHTLKQIQAKIEDSISRFYFLLSLNSDKDHERFKNLKIRFIALIFSQPPKDKNITSTTDPNFAKIYGHQFENIHKIFRERGGQLKCVTILDQDLRVPLKFFCEGFDKTTGSMKISFNNIEKEVKKIRASNK
jgi:hypothetical protein